MFCTRACIFRTEVDLEHRRRVLLSTVTSRFTEALMHFLALGITV